MPDDGDRLSRSATASRLLSGLDDEDLAAMLRGGQRGHGIGGAHHVLDVGGITVFAKAVPLTDEERRAARSTANLYDLPLACQYGVGSPGFNVWREVAAHEETTRWVRDGAVDGFPLLHHWRVLPGSDYAVRSDPAEASAAVSFFGGDPAVGTRIEAMVAAEWSVVLFLEHVPHNVHDWLSGELARDDASAAVAIGAVLDSLPSTLQLMNDRGLFHFDAHLSNILTDGARFHVADFGLATSTAFDLSDRERQFVVDHEHHDPAYAISKVVNQVVSELSGAVDPSNPDYTVRNDYIRQCAASGQAPGLSPAVGAQVVRFAAVTAVMNDLYWGLFDGAPFPAYPRDAVEEALSAAQ